MLDSATVLALSEADAALGHLHGLGHLITDPQLLIDPQLLMARTSSARLSRAHGSKAPRRPWPRFFRLAPKSMRPSRRPTTSARSSRMCKLPTVASN